MICEKKIVLDTQGETFFIRLLSENIKDREHFQGLMDLMGCHITPLLSDHELMTAIVPQGFDETRLLENCESNAKLLNLKFEIL